MIELIRIKGHQKTVINANKSNTIRLLIKILKKKLGTNILYKEDQNFCYVELNGNFLVDGNS